MSGSRPETGRRLRHVRLGLVAGLIAIVCLAFGVGGGAAVHPEPERPRTASAPPLRVVGLGDSVPAGSACDCSGFVQAAASRLAAERGRTARVANYATGGFTSADVVAELDRTDVRAALAAADVVVVEVGANDFDETRVYDPGCLDASSSGCFDPTLRSLKANLTAVVTAAHRLNPRTRVVLIGYWNVFRDGQVGGAEGQVYVDASDSLTRSVNTVVRAVAGAQGALYVDAYTAFKGVDGDTDVTSYLADDGDHPNSDGHAVLASAVVDTVDGRVDGR